MTLAPGSIPSDPSASEASEGEVPAVVAVGRTIGGILLVLIGVVLIVVGAIWYFIVPWFTWAAEGFWFQMGEWSDLGGAAVGVIGILLAIVGGALVQRARKRRLQIFMDADDVALLTNAAQAGDTTEKRTAEQPPTIL